MNQKKALSVLLASAMVCSMLTGCGESAASTASATSAAAAPATAASAAATSAAAETATATTSAAAKTQDFSGQSIEVDIGGEIDNDSLDEFDKLVAAFADQTGAKIEVVHNGQDHEQIMKTRMASNSMPDIWSTHGWSTMRYTDFLADLAGEPWVSNMDDAIAKVVTDANGKVCTMPMSQWIYGMVYDKKVLSDNGIDPASIQCWDDFLKACETLKKAGITPISSGDKTPGYLGAYLEEGNSYYTIDGAPYPSNDALKKGTFDWTANQQALQGLAGLWDAGYINTDVFTTDTDTMLRNLGTGKFAFDLWGSPQNVNTLREYFPDREYGIMPIPAIKADGNSAYTVGEGLALGISKDTKSMDLCKALLNYLASTETLTEFIKVNGNLPGMKGTTVEGNESIALYNESVANTKNITYSNFFDREYLPSGMWNIMEESVAMLFNGDVGTAKDRVADASKHMQENYTTLFETNG
jgi:raffinose/stachyose/melibiose transport system substrate-binding protein